MNTQILTQPAGHPATRPLLAEAKAAFSDMVAIEGEIRKGFERLLPPSWMFGKKLCELKEAVGHGRWSVWLGANFKDLSEIKSQRCMQLYKKNENLFGADIEDFTKYDLDSLRYFFGGYLPEKIRNQIPGDKALPPARHHLTAVNHLTIWTRRLEIGLVTRPDIEDLRRDFEQPLKRLIDVLGPDWVRGLAEN